MSEHRAERPWRWDDLSRHPAVRALLASRWFPAAPQWVNLFALAGLVAIGWGRTEEAQRYANLASWTVWVIWWPFVVGSALLAGRLWCAICPLRLVADGCGAIGPRRAPPAWLEKRDPGPTLAMVAGLILVHSTVVSFEVHHVPHRTSIYLAALMLYAAGAGLALGRGAFCRVLCPLASFFGAYARLSPTELRPRDRGVCPETDPAGCPTPCLRACPSNLSVPKIDSNKDCLLCFECLKACPNANVRFGFRRFGPHIGAGSPMSFASLLVVAVLLGIVLEELGEEWEAFGAAMLAVPAWMTRLGIPATFPGGYAWLKTLWLNLALPLGLLLCAGAASRLLAPGGTVLDRLRTYGIAFLPLIFSAHLAKLLGKVNERIAHAPHVLADPAGVRAAEAFAGSAPPEPPPFVLPAPAMGWLLLGLVALGLWVSVGAAVRIGREMHPHDTRAARRSAAPFLALLAACAAVFLAGIDRWLIG